ncbi:uncharacterized protein [Hyperolius riggenbachi]|uniref:uncharacterized protein n=1 Tax=Hyperolius riggenbachi TaxID=752182 RepID=UPI0035A2ED9F
MSSDSSTAFFIYLMLLGVNLSWGYKPRIFAIPSRVVKRGDGVTIQCESDYRGVFRIRKKNDGSWYKDSNHDIETANFNLTAGEISNDMTLYCMQHYNNRWLEDSDSITLKIIDLQKPAISAQWKGDSKRGRIFSINCTASKPPEECNFSTFHLFSNKEGEVKPYTAVTATETKTWIFVIPEKDAIHNLQCRYILQVKEVQDQFIESPLSNILQPSDHKKEDGQSEDSSIATEEGTEDQDDKKPEGYLIPVIAAVCGVLVVTLLAIIIVYTIRKKNSSKDKIDSDLLQTDHTEAGNDPTYCTVEENRYTANTNVEINVQNTAVDDGITYAVLNKDKLKMKENVPGAADETHLYAEVRKTHNN